MYTPSILITLFSTLLSVPISVSAAPTTTSPIQSSKPFKLISKSLTAPFHFSNLYIETYHISPAINYATLYALSEQTHGVDLQLNGTAAEFKHKQTTLIFPLQGFSESWQITKEGDTHPVQISVGEGTKGIFLDGKGDLQYSKPKSDGWYGEF